VESLFAKAVQCLGASSPDERVRLTEAAVDAWRTGRLTLDTLAGPAPGRPAHPERPRLVPPQHVPRRRLRSVRGRAAFVHALAHIEFNAIGLAWDCVARFRDLPRAFYDDWVGVAADEARHFTMLRSRLHQLGAEYGDFDAHDGLWEMAGKTRHDLLARMAMVPRVLEARGLDVTPGMIARLHEADDPVTAAMLDVILEEEVGHVAAGTRWFRYECERRRLEPLPTFRDTVARYWSGRRHPPTNAAHRLRAGFTEEELRALTEDAAADHAKNPSGENTV